MTATRGVRRLAAAAAVAALCVAALAAAGSPGSLHHADPAWWLVVAVVVVAVAALGWAAVALLRRYDRPREARQHRAFDRSGLLTYLLIVVVVGGLFWAFFSLLPGGGKGPPLVLRAPRPLVQPHSVRPARSIHYTGPDLTPYVVILVGLAVLALLGYVVVSRVRSIPDPVEEPDLAPGVALAAAIDAALIDLEGEADPRRAVIKAYGRMETVLSAHGLPRDPAEAPLEYLDRVLRELGGQARDVDRLTELFEQAAFSKHEVGPAMRDEAVAAFHALRDSLSAAAGGAA